jgi:hypothetical protein
MPCFGENAAQAQACKEKGPAPWVALALQSIVHHESASHYLRSSFGGALSFLGEALSFLGGAAGFCGFGAGRLVFGALSLGAVSRALGAGLGLFSAFDSVAGRLLSRGTGFAIWLSGARGAFSRAVFPFSGRLAVLLLFGGTNG